MTKHKATYTMENPELNAEMIKDAYNIMDYIERLESIEHDDTSSLERRQAATNEKDYQILDLEELKAMMKDSRSGFMRIVFYKYIEGYTLQEVADVLGLSYGNVAKVHAKFTSYLKDPEKYKPKKKPDIKKVIKALDELLNPKHEIECKNCGCINQVPDDVANKIYDAKDKALKLKGKC